jgi:hypothetical protein
LDSKCGRYFDFQVICANENSNKFQKTRFWKGKSVENVVTLEGLPFNSSMISFHIWAVQKIDTYIAKQCSHVEFPYSFCNGFTLGPKATLVDNKANLTTKSIERVFMCLSYSSFANRIDWLAIGKTGAQ